jgi:hypothetical protein
LRGAFISVNYSAARQVVRGKFNSDTVAQQDTDVVLAHLARKISQYLVAIVKPYTELSAWQCLNDSALYIYFIFFLVAHLAYPLRIGRNGQEALSILMGSLCLRGDFGSGDLGELCRFLTRRKKDLYLGLCLVC